MTLDNGTPSSGDPAVYGYRDLFKSMKRIARKPVLWVLLVAVSLAVALVVTSVNLRSARSQLQASSTDRAASCRDAKLRALSAAESVLRWTRDDPGPLSVSTTWSAGYPINIVMFACPADSHDVVAMDKANEIHFVIRGLMRTRQFDEVDRLIQTLRQTPLEEWKDVVLPPKPSEAEEKAADAAAEAAQERAADDP